MYFIISGFFPFFTSRSISRLVLRSKVLHQSPMVASLKGWALYSSMVITLSFYCVISAMLIPRA